MLRKPVLYPNLYHCYLAACALDILFTSIILTLGGMELNTVADRVLQAWGLPGMILFKLATIALVLLICEYVGRQKPETGRCLAVASIVISAFPVAVALTQFASLVTGHTVIVQ